MRNFSFPGLPVTVEPGMTEKGRDDVTGDNGPFSLGERVAPSRENILALTVPHSVAQWEVESWRFSMRTIDFVLWKEGRYYVAQCLNVDVSSFGETIAEAIANLKEAVELYLEGEEVILPEIDEIMIGREKLRA